MKKIVVLIFAFLTLTSVYSQTDVYRSMTPIMDSLSNYVNVIEKYGTEVVFIQSDVISKTCEKSTFRNFSKNWTYSILVFGDWRIKEIAVEIFKITDDDTPDIYIKGCHDKKHFATVDFKPDDECTYMITVAVTKFVSGFDSAHYGIMIFHE